MELDVDKVYRYSVFSTRKKNYLGVFPDGSVDIKGLTGKKRNTPEFLKKAFSDMVNILSGVKSPEEFEKAREEIKEIVKTCYLKLKRREYTLNDLAFTIVLGKGVDEYRETTPQHVKAAKLLPEEKVQSLGRGDVIRFVKVTGREGVKPVELASLNEIDVDKYMEYVETTFEQVLDALGLDFREILGLTRLEYFMADFNEKP
jgi:DNA polymerase I